MANFPGARVRTNNAFGTVTDNPLLIGATTINSAGLANLGAVTAGDHAILVLDPLRAAGAPEIVTVTAHTASATTATITRASYGTVARQHASGTLWVNAATIWDAIHICTSATRPADVYRGQLIFEIDTNSFVARDTSDTWQTVVPLGAWTSYTPTLTQSVAVAKTVNYAKYIRVGRMINAQISMTASGTGTAANDVKAGLPVPAALTPAAFTLVIGAGYIYDASASAVYKATVELSTSSVVAFRPTTTSANDFLGSAVLTAALATGDIVTYTVTYEAAS